MDNKILVTRSSMPDFDEYIDEIRGLWNSHWLTNMGEKHQTLLSMLKEYLDSENVQLLVNGHMALELSLQAMGLEGEVITTPFTFVSTTHAIVRNGLTPVFCDINPNDYTIDVNQIESLITEKTCAIMPVHVYGNICDVEAIDAIAKKHNLKVIYDAAHSFGEKYKGRNVANFGDVSCFSFHATKVFNTIEGGAVVAKSDDMIQKLYDLKNFGIHGEESIPAIGSNAKMNEFCAAMGICNLRHLDREINKRKHVDELYRKLLANVDGIRTNEEQPNVERNYSYFPIIIDEKVYGKTRDEVYDLLKANDIYARKYFYPAVNEIEAYKDSAPRETPVAHDISMRVLTLPMYADLDDVTINRICELLTNK